jgi:hypothetical protein
VAFGRKKAVPAGTLGPIGDPVTDMRAAERRASLVGAAVPIHLGDAASWQMFKLGDHRWQWEAWRHYDICGEMRFVVNWVGQAISRCRMYAAEVTDDGTVGDETDDAKIKLIAETMFGTAASKAQAQRLMGINMMVAGDVFIVAEGYQNADEDKWYVCSSSEVFRRGDDIMVRRSITHGGGQYKLNPETDLLIRAWNPHPRRYDAADSTVRAILPVLRELEQCTKRVFAELDSRLAGAGILLLPENIDFPRPPTENPGDPQPSGAEGFLQILQNTMATSMQQRDSAAAVVPIILQVATEALDKIKHLTFDSSISDHISQMRKDAVTRMAMSLDIPPEVLTGMGGSNHWSSWQIEESSIKIHIEPLLIQLADALNIGYFQPALKAAGVQNPEKYTLWFDVGPLAVRPNRSDQAMQFAEKEYISAKAARDNAAFTDDDAPDDKELVYNLTKALVLAQPGYAADPEVQKILGLPKILPPPAAAAPPDPNADLMPGDPGYDDAGTDPADAGTRGLPQFPSVADAEQGNVGGKSQKLGALAASAAERKLMDAIDPDRKYRVEPGSPSARESLFFAADAAVHRALELAGGRLVAGPARARYPVGKHLLHTRVAADPARVPALLAGAWDHLREQSHALSVDPDALQQLLEGYCTELLTRGVAHDPGMLRQTLHWAHGELTS